MAQSSDKGTLGPVDRSAKVEDVLQHVGTFLALILLVYLLGSVLMTVLKSIVRFFRNPRKFFSTVSRPKRATEKQLNYLAALVREQNGYRSKAISFDEWIQRKAKSGRVSARFASKLIQSMKSQNEDLRAEFDALKRRSGLGTFKGEIHVSDLHAFEFCQRSAYYSSHRYPSQNLIDLGFGSRIHQAYSDSARRDHRKPARVADYIRKIESDAERIEWVSDVQGEILRHPSLPLSGRPDGYVHYRDGSRAVIEMKAVAQIPQEPRKADFVQADAYALLASRTAEIRGESFVLYMNRSTRELSLHKRRRTLTEYDLARMVAQIERGSRSINELQKVASTTQCQKCGFRSICSGVEKAS